MVHWVLCVVALVTLIFAYLHHYHKIFVYSLGLVAKHRILFCRNLQERRKDNESAKCPIVVSVVEVLIELIRELLRFMNIQEYMFCLLNLILRGLPFTDSLSVNRNSFQAPLNPLKLIVAVIFD